MWVKIDSDYAWLRSALRHIIHLLTDDDARSVELRQDTFMWVYQARLERNVASQIEVWDRAMSGCKLLCICL
jgi:hypothetical protein